MTVLVLDWVVPVRVSVPAGHRRNVDVFVMAIIVSVSVVVLDRLMAMKVGVAVRHQQGHPDHHEARGSELGRAEHLAEDRHREQRSEEWTGGEQGGLPGCTDRPERVRVEHDADPVRNGAEHARSDDRAERRQVGPEQ